MPGSLLLCGVATEASPTGSFEGATVNNAMCELGPATLGRILIIEADGVLRNTLRELFFSEGYEVALSPDGLAGLKMLRPRRPSAVIVDLQHPGASGCALFRKIANLIPGLPLVILNVSPELADRVLLLETGCRGLRDHTVQFARTCCATARPHKACIPCRSGKLKSR